MNRQRISPEPLQRHTATIYQWKHIFTKCGAADALILLAGSFPLMVEIMP